MLTNVNLAYAIHRHRIATPKALAVVGQQQALSYQELAEQAATLALHLTTSRTFNRRSDGQPPRVGILASRSEAACVAVLGACWAGATYVPIGVKQPANRVRALLAQCDLAALITDNAGIRVLNQDLRAACPSLVLHAGQADNVPADCTDISILATLPPAGPAEPAPMSTEDTGYIIFTSGSTGVPKGVMVSTGALRHYLSTIVEYLALRPNDRAMETCELSFDFSVHNMFSTWEAGAALHILPSTTVMNAVRFARDAEITVWNSVPSLAAMLRQVKALKPASLPKLRVTVFGGEPLPASTVSAWRQAAPNSTVFNLYGPTEATVFCAALPVSEPLSLAPGRDVIAIGRPLAGNEVAVVNDEGNPLPHGTPGELAIAGPQLADGYLGEPELTRERFPEWGGKRWYRTGDLAVHGNEGYLHCLGRLDNQVKVLGHRIELEEIDAHLRMVSGSELVGSVAWPIHDGMASGIVSFVAVPWLNSDSLLDALKTRVPSYMLPSRIIVLEQLPRNGSGKVDRHALQRMLEDEP